MMYEAPPQQTPNATSACEASLWARYRDEMDPTARQELLHIHGSLAKTVASNLQRKLRSLGMHWEDISQTAAIGLLEAVDRFDPAQGVHFSAFATKRIRGAILNDIVKHSEFTAQLAYRREVMRERAASIRSDGQRDLFLEMVDIAVGLAVGYMLENTGLFQDEAKAANELMPQQGPGEMEIVRAQFKGLVSSLNENQREVVNLHYFEDIKFADIARRMNLSRARVTQLHAEALKRLRSLRIEHVNLDEIL